MKHSDVKRAIDTSLSGLTVSAQACDAIFRQAKGEKNVRKKLSTALVLALVLALLAVGALAAALLSGRQFVSEVMEPRAQKSQTDWWTKDEVAEIMRAAEERGIAFAPEDRERILAADGQYKEELMRLFVKLDLGFYPSAWSIEDQAWYDALLVEGGLTDERRYFLPEAGEIPQAAAVAAAQEAIAKQHGGPVALENESVYRRHVTYGLQDIGTGEREKIWYVEYQSLDVRHDGYVVYMRPDGGVAEVICFPGAGNADATPTQVMDSYIDILGSMDTWDVETWVTLQRDMQSAAERNPEIRYGRRADAVLRQAYGLPDAQAVGRDEALSLAEAALPEDAEAAPHMAYALYLLGEEVPVWKAVLPTGVGGTWLVELNAYTGEIRNVHLHDVVRGENGVTYTVPLYARYVLHSLVEEMEAEEIEGVG